MIENRKNNNQKNYKFKGIIELIIGLIFLGAGAFWLSYFLQHLGVFSGLIIIIIGITVISIGIIITLIGIRNTLKSDFKRKRVISITAILIILILIISGIIIIARAPYSTYSYRIELNVEGTGDYSIILPVPEYDSEPSHIVFKLINESENATLIETEYGTGLMINGTESIVLEVSGKSSPDYNFHEFSMHYKDIQYHIFSNYSNNIQSIEVKIRCLSDSHGGRYHKIRFYANGSIINGWTLIDGIIEEAVE